MKISANQLPAHLGKKLAPCYFVTGDEVLLVQEALDAIRGRARQAGFDSRDLYVAASGFDWSEFSAAGGNLSLFAQRRIIELQLPTGRPGRQGADAILRALDGLGDDLLLLVSAPKLDRAAASAKWAKALESAGVLVQVWPVSLRELPGWVNGRMRAVGLAPDRDAVQLVVDRVEGNLLAAQQEIEKLRLLHGEGALTAEDVDASVADSSRFDVYKLVDAAVAGDASRALRILAGVRSEGTDAVIVLWALTRELRVLAGLAESVRAGMDLSKALQAARVWSNRQALLRACVGRLSMEQLFSLIQLARRADAAAKGQSGEDAWQLAAQILLGVALKQERAA